jgi:transposase-like protein
MKLTRKYARIAIAFCVAAVLFILSAFIFRSIVLSIFGALLITVSAIIRFVCLRCPNCGRYSAPPRWSYSIKTYHCPGCGKPFEYDDE